ncbi:hypothetical protein FA743_14395 [Paracoccus gahaiensis]|uniref:Uncharacterized protein n=1 Tax=Paracoccus gahaiensis TaxID=1706839 RepID=A0A4U0R6Q6_9RHOB|nr:hypothetical protein [Paracoccus gahaiensis]TJZ90587.1 hypothetical protein FA743_14395 [Paracoccus gahaiensis]
MNTRNAVSELCELVIRVEPSAARECELDCIVELRLASGDVDLGDETCEISISKLTLSLALEGATPVPGSRFGEPRRQPTSEMDRVVTQGNDVATAFKASAKANLDITGPTLGSSASGQVEASVRRETVLTTHDRLVHHRVKAMPNLRWEVREADDSQLDGTYLESDSLVRFTRTERANRTAVLARATVKQRDVTIGNVVRDPISWRYFKRFSTTQRRLLDIFIAKSIDSALRGSGKYVGEITLSSANIELPDEE